MYGGNITIRRLKEVNPGNWVVLIYFILFINQTDIDGAVISNVLHYNETRLDSSFVLVI